MINEITTTHNLNFEASELSESDREGYDELFDKEIKYARCKVGTCVGVYYYTPTALVIKSIINKKPHNGHLEDFFEWFYYSCKKNKLHLVIEDFINERFRIYLLKKRGFSAPNKNQVLLNYKNIPKYDSKLHVA